MQNSFQPNLISNSRSLSVIYYYRRNIYSNVYTGRRTHNTTKLTPPLPQLPHTTNSHSQFAPWRTTLPTHRSAPNLQQKLNSSISNFKVVCLFVVLMAVNEIVIAFLTFKFFKERIFWLVKIHRAAFWLVEYLKHLRLWYVLFAILKLSN